MQKPSKCKAFSKSSTASPPAVDVQYCVQKVCRASLWNLAAWVLPLQSNLTGGRASLFGLSVQKSLGLVNLALHTRSALSNSLHAALHSFQDLIGVAVV